MRDDAEEAIRQVRQRRAFSERLDRAVDSAQATLLPLFDTLNYGGVLSGSEAELLHEIMFKLAMLRSVIIQGDVAARDVHNRWLAAQGVRRRRARYRANGRHRPCRQRIARAVHAQ